MSPEKKLAGAFAGAAAVGVGLFAALAPATHPCDEKIPANVACVRWSASPGWSNSSPYLTTEVVSYELWRVSKTNVDSGFLVDSTSNLYYKTTPGQLDLGERCFVVRTKVITALGVTSFSAFSNMACKTLKFPAPTDGAIESPSDGAIEDR